VVDYDNCLKNPALTDYCCGVVGATGSTALAGAFFAGAFFTTFLAEAFLEVSLAALIAAQRFF
jgi:hypothetical protein